MISTVDQTANYAGLQASVDAAVVKNNDVQVGVYGFAQRQSNFFNNVFPDCGMSCQNFGPSSAAVTGGLAEAFVSDRFKVTPWLTLIAGIRQSHFTTPAAGTQPGVTENATDPRFGVALRIPHLNWVFHGFYGHFYQAPPLLTASGPLLDLATSQTLTFAPLKGERDEEYQFGISIPLRGWVLEEDTFQTRAHNWLDHSNIGESNIFWPITWNAALIQGWETTLPFSAPVAPRSGPPGLRLESDRTGQRAFAPEAWSALPPAPAGCPVAVPPEDMRRWTMIRVLTLNVGFNATLPQWQVLRFDECLLRLGIHQRDAGRAISGGELSARAHYLSMLPLGKKLW